jgi:alpha-tubulin suppressor-like RCC1 family protein
MLTAAAPGVATISVSTGSVSDSATVVVRSLEFAHVFTGDAVSCGLEATGDAWCWGNVGPDGYGNGSLDSTRTLVPSRAAVGHAFSTLAISLTSACGAELSGGVVCWGANDHGQLGDGTTTPHGAPVAVPGVSNAIQLAAGAAHYCARSDAGAVTCWGSNEWKQAGQETRALVTTPHTVALGGAATDLSAGDDYSCVVVAGQGKCWGADYFRQLGNDTTYDRLVPVRAATGDGVARSWTDLQGVADNTCARDQAGAMFCWGIVEAEGDNDTTEWLPTRHFPSATIASMGDGWFARCAVDQQGAVWCERRSSDAPEQLAMAGVQSVAVSGAPCTLSTAGAVTCAVPALPDSVVAIALPTPAVRLVATSTVACTLDTSHVVYCWSTWSLTQNNVPDQWFAGHSVTALFANGDDRVCIIAADNTVSCRDDSQSATESLEPTGGQTFDSLAIGQNHTCGLTPAGAAWCWGKNDHGQLGDGTTTDRAAPVQVQGGHVFVQIASGWNHTCGRTSTGEIWCWGHGSDGQMADDHRDESATPLTVGGAPSLTAISGSCALSAGSAWCWATSTGGPAAHQIAGATGLEWFKATGLLWYQNFCGLRAGGELLCWGSNGVGVFGNGTLGNTYTDVVTAANGTLFKEVSLSNYATACGIGLDGKTYCWGNGYGTVPVVMVGS